MADTNQCEHEICNCPTQGDENYCSDHCREAATQDIIEIKCDCQHSGCD